MATFPHEMFEALGYRHRLLNGQKMHHGVATLSRVPLTEDRRHDWQDNGEARHIGARLARTGGRRAHRKCLCARRR